MDVGNPGPASIGPGLLWMSFDPLRTGSSRGTGLIGSTGSTRFSGLIGSADFTVDDDSAGSSAIRGRIRIRLTGNIGLAGAAC